MNIKDLKYEDRPRERIIRLGARALSDVELLAILIGNGTKSHTVLDIASNILKLYSLPELKDLTYSKLSKLKGVKQAKACKLLACFELARRSAMKKRDLPSLENAEDIYNYVYHEIYLESNEIVLAILVDCKLKPIKIIIERSKSTHHVEIPTKEILKEALDTKAYGVILVHNHPSEEVEASLADITVTHQLQQIFMTLDILLLDHLVVSQSNYYSMHEHGLLLLEEEYSVIGEDYEKNTM